jgi:hypothetical protein
LVVFLNATVEGSVREPLFLLVLAMGREGC